MLKRIIFHEKLIQIWDLMVFVDEYLDKTHAAILENNHFIILINSENNYKNSLFLR